MDEITRVRNLKKGDSFFYNGIEFIAERFISAEKVVGVSNDELFDEPKIVEVAVKLIVVL